MEKIFFIYNEIFFKGGFFMKKIIKNKSNIIAILILIVSITAFLSYNIFFREDTNSSYALSKYGSRSDEVKQI